MPALSFPQAEDTDSEAVADALDAGLLHWAKGETANALRCLRDARNAADEAGDDRRALALARLAAELAPQDMSTSAATPLPLNSDPQQPEPRRSRLPEPPAPSKKYVSGTPEGAASSSARATPRHEPVHESLTPHATKYETGAGNLSKSPLSGRPTPPSTRPGANTSVAPANPVGSRGASTTTASVPRPYAAPMAKAEAARSDAAKPDTATADAAKPDAAKPDADTADTADTDTAKLVASATQAAKPEVREPERLRSHNEPVSVMPFGSAERVAPSQAAAKGEHRAPRGDALDHRLASLRVRIERVEADGTVRLKLLDLAATASGEDNAILVVQQSLWQELKRGS